MDFQQGPITTIHDYGTDADAAGLLRRGLQQRPTSLLIPCLMEEFSRPALGLIREVLRELDGLQELVIALSAGTAEECCRRRRSSPICRSLCGCTGPTDQR